MRTDGPRALSKPVALTALALGVIAYVAAAAVYAHWAGKATLIEDVELAGSAKVIAGIVGTHTHRYVVALYVDFGYIAGYTIAILTGAWLGARLCFTRAARRIALIAMAAVVVAALCDVGENLLLLPVVRHPSANHDHYAVAAQAFSFTKWVLVIPAAVIAVVAAWVVLWRAVVVPRLDRLPGRRQEAAMTAAVLATREDPVLQPVAAMDDVRTGQSVWRANSTVPPERRAAPGAEFVGVCSSGGGIRSATVNLGALDALRPVVRQARYLVSVSGGGFAASALQLALQSPSVATPADVYAPGSAELDHTRRHSKYLADGAAQWLNALVGVLRGVLVNLVTLALIVVLIGRVVAHGYTAFPHDLLRQGGWPPQPGVAWAAGVLAGIWLVLWIVVSLIDPHLPRVLNVVRRIGTAALGAAALVTFAGVALPALAWSLGAPPRLPVLVSAQTATVVGGYVATLAALAKRQPAVVRLVRARLQTLVVWLGLLAVVGGLVLLLGEVLATTGPAGTTSSWPGHLREWWITAAVAGAVVFFALVDQVRWSLHPFYKRRLASAFAVRRTDLGGVVRAAPYDFSEVTALNGAPHHYGDRVAGFPQVIFACAAHVSGQRLAPPGRQVVPWTMSGDYVGSPVIGWTRTSDVYAQVAPTLRLDLTVEAAAAISGAAIASQMGRMNAAYTKLLTLTNVRLGSWLPNPAYLRRLFTEPARWWLPRLPRRRYLLTWFRELFGAYPDDGPLVYVTDGGHYENLGLVELLRLRPSTVYCVDASGDHPDVATTLAQAVELAYEELGAVVTLDRPERLGAGTGTVSPPASDQLHAELQPRFAEACVVTGTIEYPDLGPELPAARGRIVVGKAVLTRNMPFDVLAHAARNPTFPHENTADQWFDHAQYDAYHALGRYLGAAMLSA